MTTQDVFELQGFIVLAYTDQSEYEKELTAGIVIGNTINGEIPDDAILRVIGIATSQEWAMQCETCGDPVWLPWEPVQIGWLKVVAE